MKTVLFYLDFFIYMFMTKREKNKVEKLEKQGDFQQAENSIDECVRNWSLHVLNKVGVRLEVKGKENITGNTCVYVANHQGFFDIPVLISTFDKPLGFIAKKEILKFKMVSYWMKKIHCIFIDRKNIRESMKAINEGVDNLKNGYSMVIFPEGTRSKGPKVGEFKKGSMKLALKSGVPIIPIAINGTYKIREGNKRSAIKSGDVTVSICKPIYVEELSKIERTNLSEHIKTIIENNIN
jgi:1-acyl-sn-glycerol-3-phosphate acyltransferase